jgi:predicted regulator of Ras-like GTPase activity (Roadblock/LC7/MglB family)
MQPHAIDALLASLRHATSLPTWRCANLLFQLPPNATWINNKVEAVVWPERLRVHLVSEPMTGASSVWNAMLGVWNEAKLQPGWDPAAVSPMLGISDFPVKVDEIGGFKVPVPDTAAPAAAAAAATGKGVLDAVRARNALSTLLKLDGLLGCALVDAVSGLVLAHDSTDPDVLDMELAGAACAQVLAAHRDSARAMGLGDAIDEVITTAGARHVLIRSLQRHAGLVLVAVLEKNRTNLALARFQLLEVERGLH